MGIPCKCDPGYDPNAKKPTPMKKSSQPALRADVSRVGEASDPGSLTCIIFNPMVQPYFWSKIGRESSGSGIYKWLRLYDFRDMKNWPICDFFLIKQPEDEQEAIVIQTVIRYKGKILYFSNLPNKVLYCLNGIYVPPSVLKVTQGQYFATLGKLKIVS
jgi:hypothetical protein